MKCTLSCRRALVLMLILTMAACAAPQAPPPAAPGITTPQAPPGAPLAPSAAPAPTAAKAPKDLLGNWKGTSPDGQPVAMNFRAEGRITVTVGSEANEGTFTVDFSKAPGRLDIQGSWLEGAVISTLIEMVDKTRLRIENSAPGQPRPGKFTSDSTVFTKE